MKSVPRGAGDRRKRGEGEGRRFHELSSRAVVVSFPLRFHFSDQFFQELNGVGKREGEGVRRDRGNSCPYEFATSVVGGRGGERLPRDSLSFRQEFDAREMQACR